MPNIGIITLEDAETGEQIEINTADRATRARFARAGRSAAGRTRLERCAGTTSTRSRCAPATTICRRCVPSSSNASAAWLFDETPCRSVLAEEFHDIAPPVDYSLVPTVGHFLARVCRADALGLIVWWFIDAGGQNAPPPQIAARTRARALDRIANEIETVSPYQFSIRVSDILRRYVTEQYNCRSHDKHRSNF